MATVIESKHASTPRHLLPRRLLAVLVLAALWTGAAFVVDDRTLPSPWQVAFALQRELVDGELLLHVLATLARTCVAFVAAMLLGTLLGAWLGASRRADEWLDAPLLLALNVPALVTIILCYIWFGLNESAAIIAVTLNKFPTVAVIVREGARAVDHELLAVGRGFRVNRLRFLQKVYLPQIYPQLAAAARSVFALSWKIVLVVELLGRPDGVGFQLRRMFNYFDVAGVLAYTIAFMAVVMLIEQAALRPAERWFNRWRET